MNSCCVLFAEHICLAEERGQQEQMWIRGAAAAQGLRGEGASDTLFNTLKLPILDFN